MTVRQYKYSMVISLSFLCFIHLININSTYADLLELTPSNDNTIYSEDPELSNAKGINLFSGRTLGSQGTQNRRALLAFDLSAVPAGATIDSASLTLEVNKIPRGGVRFEPFEVKRLEADWGEGTSNAGSRGGKGAPASPGDATWSHREFGSALWSTPGGGGDFSSTVSASLIVGGLGSYTWSSDGLRDDVQAWNDGTVENHGWILIGNENVQTTAKMFASRENPNALIRPKLTINFTPSVGLPGDMNDDTMVNQTDLDLFIDEYGRTDANGFGEGDFNDDNNVGLVDLLLLKQNFDPIAAAPAVAIAVPEPGTMFLLLFSVAVLLLKSSVRFRVRKP